MRWPSRQSRRAPRRRRSPYRRRRRQRPRGKPSPPGNQNGGDTRRTWAMRRIVMFNRVTADGYFAGPDGNLDWVVPDDAIDIAGVEAMPGADTMLFGRRTYELFEGFWPHALDDSPNAPDPHRAG